jgi:hypothetical protein
VNVREPDIPSAESKRELCVIDPEQMEHGGMQVVDSDGFVDGFVTVLVGRAVD